MEDLFAYHPPLAVMFLSQGDLFVHFDTFFLVVAHLLEDAEGNGVGIFTQQLDLAVAQAVEHLFCEFILAAFFPAVIVNALDAGDAEHDNLPGDERHVGLQVPRGRTIGEFIEPLFDDFFAFH